jgi:hypothetical protein
MKSLAFEIAGSHFKLISLAFLFLKNKETFIVFSCWAGGGGALPEFKKIPRDCPSLLGTEVLSVPYGGSLPVFLCSS